MTWQTWYGRCNKCGRIKTFITGAAAREFEVTCCANRKDTYYRSAPIKPWDRPRVYL